MTEEEQTALAAEVEAEVKVLENTSSQLKKAQKWAFDQADELRTRLKEGKTSDSRELLIRRAPANSVIDYEEEKTKNFAAGVNFYKIAIILISGSFAGVIIEMLWCFIRHGYFESRAGLYTVRLICFTASALPRSRCCFTVTETAAPQFRFSAE